MPAFVVEGVARAELLPAASYEAAYTPDAPVIGFAFEAQAGMHSFASDRRRPFEAPPNHLSFVPAGCDVYSQSERGGEYLRIVLERGAAGGHSPERLGNMLDIRAIPVAERLRRRLLAGVHDELEIAGLVAALSDRVSLMLLGGEPDGRETGWMTSRRLRLSLEQIEDQLATKLTVHGLAASIGLSASFFSRAFREAVGKPPHEYILDRRVACARRLLRSGAGNLAAIAQATGFSSHAHMTSVFRKRLGITPSDFVKQF